MGQDISLIVTRDYIKDIPENISHLYRNGFLIINLKKSEFDYFVYRVLRSYKTEINDYLDENFDFINIIKELGIKNFLAIHGGIPSSETNFAVIDENVIIESISIIDFEIYEDDLFIEIPKITINAMQVLNYHNNFEPFHNCFDFIRVFEKKIMMQIKDIVKKVKQIEIRTRKKTEASLMGQYHSAFKGQGMTFSEVRQYQFGDDTRRIDWNKTARFREPFVKVMEEERELTMMLVVDISASMDYGTKNQLKREYVAEICASLGFSATGNNDKVGLILYADKVLKVVPPQKGRKHVLSIISNILTADYVPAQSNLNSAFNYMMSVFKRKSLVFVFSDFEDEFDQKILNVTARKHQLLGLRVFDEKDMEIPDIGYALFRDAETGKQLWANTSSARWRYDFAEKQKQKMRYIKDEFENSSANFLDINTSEDYSKLLYQYFRK